MMSENKNQEEQQHAAGIILRHQIFHPSGRPLGVILIFPAFEGWSDFLTSYAEFFASQGFIGVAVDYYGLRQVGHTLDECFSLAGPYFQDRGIVRNRAIAIFEHFRNLYPALRIGTMGFCFGVQFVLELARTQKELKAAVGAHGLLARSELPGLPQIDASVLMLQGYNDPMVPSSDCLEFAQEMRDYQVRDWNLVFIGNAQHSFTDPKTGSFDAQKEKEMGRVFDAIAAARVKKWATDFFIEKFQPAEI